jgi:hypothetical protein
MDQGTDQPLAQFAAAAIPTDAAARYRAQVERVHNNLSLTGLPAREWGIVLVVRGEKRTLWG